MAETHIPHPLRIQRKRTKGWRMPPDAVYVGRPTIFGNPFVISAKCPAGRAVKLFRRFLKMSQNKLYDSIRDENGNENPLGGLDMLLRQAQIKKQLSELRGKKLACFCPLDRPCHADVLAELAND